MLLLTGGETLEVVIKFLTHYCGETDSKNIEVILATLVNMRNSQQQELSEWKKFLTTARFGAKLDSDKQIYSLPLEFTEKEAFDAMVLLLEEQYKTIKSDDLGGCLSDLLYGTYGDTSDPATNYFWQKFLHEVKGIKH